MRRVALSLMLMMVWQCTSRAQNEGTVFKSKPKNITCPANDPVKFDCSVYKGDILWFVNDIFALGLPPELNVSFKTKSVGSLINSTLEFIAKESVNNSQIVCAVRGIQQPTTEVNAAAKLVVTQDVDNMNGRHSQQPKSNGAAHNQNWLIGTAVIVLYSLINGVLYVM